MYYPNFQYPEQLNQLIAMGFDREISMTALTHFKGDIDQALRQLEPKQQSVTPEDINYEAITRVTTTPSGLLNVGNSKHFY